MKSDDVVGRVKTYEAIIKGENIPKPGTPESFKVLIKELQALALDIRVLKEDGTEVELKENLDDVDTSFSKVESGGYRDRDRDRDFRDYGYSVKEFNSKGELENVEEDIPAEEEFTDEPEDDQIFATEADFASDDDPMDE